MVNSKHCHSFVYYKATYKSYHLTKTRFEIISDPSLRFLHASIK